MKKNTTYYSIIIIGLRQKNRTFFYLGWTFRPARSGSEAGVQSSSERVLPESNQNRRLRRLRLWPGGEGDQRVVRRGDRGEVFSKVLI